MASIQKKNEAFYCQFLYQGKRYTVTVGKVSKAEAEAFAGKVELLLMRVKQKLIHVPPGVGITDFVQGDGQVRPAEHPALEKLSFSAFRQKHLETARTGMEANSLATADMHLRHFERTLGAKFPVADLQLADLQRHVHERRRKKYRRRPLSPVTLKKEAASFRAAWNWGVLNNLVTGPFPAKGLVYPKGDEKPPFMTRPEIERRFDGLSEAERDELWDCLFMITPKVTDLLDHVKAMSGVPWVYPAVVVAAHTGGAE
jgi:hypothetical protein